jgi:hypothetical protein
MLFKSHVFHQHVIHISFHVPSNLVFENFIDHPLVNSPCVFQTKKHCHLAKNHPSVMK